MTEQARATEPIVEASDGDLVEQRKLADPYREAETGEPELTDAPLEANEADAYEQSQSVPLDEDDVI